VLDILTETRKVVPANFAIGIKLNSADHSSSTFEDTMTQVKLLVEAGIDFMEISGGSYEDPQMMGYSKPQPKSERTAAREAFFLEFAKEVRKRHPGLVLMLTGGFRSRAGAEAAIQDGACDLVGIARPAAIDPKLPLLLLDESVPDEKAALRLEKAPTPFYARWLPRNLIGAGAESVSCSLLFLTYISQIWFADGVSRLITLARLNGCRRGWLLLLRLFELAWLFGGFFGFWGLLSNRFCLEYNTFFNVLRVICLLFRLSSSFQV
jgi:hypothetical protein